MLSRKKMSEPCTPMRMTAEIVAKMARPPTRSTRPPRKGDAAAEI